LIVCRGAPADPPEASADGPATAAATASPAAAPANGARHLLCVDDICPSDLWVAPVAARASSIPAVAEIALNPDGFFRRSSASARENAEM
jgi:hypothetical protein